MRRHRLTPRRRAPLPQTGFTLIEVMIAMFILAVGLLSLLALFAQGVASMQFAQEDMIAKQKAQEALESVYAARNTQQITFDQIRNVSDPSGTGIFLDGWQNMLEPGPDGLVGTADDGTSPNPPCPNTKLECVVLPGPDGLLGTADDVYLPLSNFQRQILIGPFFNADGSINPDLRQITVTIRYSTINMQARQYSVVTYVSSYR